MASEIADDLDLRKKLQKSERKKKLEAIGLITPLLIVMLVFFFVPIALMLYRSIDNSQMADALPKTALAIQAWNGEGLPNETVYAAIVEDMRIAQKEKTLAKVGRRLNFDLVGYHSLLSKSGRKIDNFTQAPYKEQLIAFDKKWGNPEYWVVMERGLKSITSIYLLAAADLKYNEKNEIVKVPEYEAIYVSIIARTVYISLSITILCLVLGFPVAYFMATSPPRIRNLLMIMLLLVFWTSLLVRTLSWILVLQNQGVVNGILMSMGIINEPLDLVFNRIGVYIAMTHVLLPFMVLPLYSVMASIPPTYMKAARSLGAKPFAAFWKVYVPQTLPGIGAGALMVFIQALGYYITPALVGGPRDQMISYFVAFFVNERVNWSMASALGVTLLILTGSLYLIFGKRVNIANMKLG